MRFGSHVFTYIYLYCRCPFDPSWFDTDPPSAAVLYGSAAAKLNRSETFHPTLQTAPEHTSDGHQSWGRATRQRNCGMWTHHVHSVAVQQLFCCQATEAVYKLLFVKQERLQPPVEGVTLCYTGLVQFVQLSDHCTQKTQRANIYFSLIVWQPFAALFHFIHLTDIYQKEDKSVYSPCLTVLDGRSWPLLMFSFAACSAADRNSSAFMYNTNCSA